MEVGVLNRVGLIRVDFPEFFGFVVLSLFLPDRFEFVDLVFHGFVFC